jgi:hypothetical protein
MYVGLRLANLYCGHVRETKLTRLLKVFQGKDLKKKSLLKSLAFNKQTLAMWKACCDFFNILSIFMYLY